MSSALDKIERILEWAEAHPSFDTSFVEDLKRQYEENGELTDMQEDAINNILRKFRI